MLDFPDVTQFLRTDTDLEHEVGWEGSSVRSPGHAQTDPWEELDNHDTRGTESPAILDDATSTHTSDSVKSKYYVHGAAWRAPFQRRFRNSRDMLKSSSDGHSPSSGFSSSAHNTNNIASSTSNSLAAATYGKVVIGIQNEAQTRLQLPPLESFQLCVDLYFQHLHPNFPFIHKPSFLTSEPHWVLLLAVAGVGATYLRSSQGLQWKDSLMQALENIL